MGKGLPPAKYNCYTIIEISYIIHIYDKKWMIGSIKIDS